MAAQPIVIQDEHTRKAVDNDVTIGDLCMEAIGCMMARDNDTQRFTVLHNGAIYYFDVTCVGVKPPYEMQTPELGSGETLWFGQRMN